MPVLNTDRSTISATGNSIMASSGMTNRKFSPLERRRCHRAPDEEARGGKASGARAGVAFMRRTPNTVGEKPNSKLQTPEKHQTPNTKSQGGRSLKLGVWSFSGVWCLVFGV